jgi:hypothetical protein
VIEHIELARARKLLADLRRILRSGGALLVTTPNYRGTWPLVEWGADRFSDAALMGGVQHITHYHRRALVRLLQDEGYRVGTVRTYCTLAPFAAALSTRLARAVDAAERRVDLRFGNLLAAIAWNDRAERP